MARNEPRIGTLFQFCFEKVFNKPVVFMTHGDLQAAAGANHGLKLKFGTLFALEI